MDLESPIYSTSRFKRPQTPLSSLTAIQKPTQVLYGDFNCANHGEIDYLEQKRDEYCSYYSSYAVEAMMIQTIFMQKNT